MASKNIDPHGKTIIKSVSFAPGNEDVLDFIEDFRQRNESFSSALQRLVRDYITLLKNDEKTPDLIQLILRMEKKLDTLSKASEAATHNLSAPQVVVNKEPVAFAKTRDPDKIYSDQYQYLASSEIDDF